MGRRRGRSVFPGRPEAAVTRVLKNSPESRNLRPDPAGLPGALRRPPAPAPAPPPPVTWSLRAGIP